MNGNLLTAAHGEKQIDETAITNIRPELPETKEKLKESDFVILAPDDPSGKAFEGRFIKSGLKLAYKKVTIRTRVIGQEKNPSVGVYADLIDAFREQYSEGHTNMIIACNTLQFWAEELSRYPELYENMPGIKIYTTFQAAKEFYPERETRPMWLGTSVTAKNLSKAEFDTPVNSGLDEIQEITQELVWRTKASSIPPADYSGAGDKYANIQSEEKLIERTKLLVQKLKDAQITEFFLGCTELPIAFGKLSKADLEGLTPIDVADLMAAKVYGELHEQKPQ